jgi:hypothetical protein
MPEYEPIVVPHPVQPKTEHEVRALAEEAMERIAESLLRP